MQIPECKRGVMFELLAGCACLAEFTSVVTWLNLFYTWPIRLEQGTRTGPGPVGFHIGDRVLIGWNRRFKFTTLYFSVFDSACKLVIQASDSTEACLLDSEHGRNMLAALLTDVESYGVQAGSILYMGKQTMSLAEITHVRKNIVTLVDTNCDLTRASQQRLDNGVLEHVHNAIKQYLESQRKSDDDLA